MIKPETTTINQLKAIITAIVVTMLILASGFAYFYKKNSQEAFKKEQKIDQMVEEIGEIKDQNERLYQSLKLSSTTQINNVSSNTIPAPKIEIKNSHFASNQQSTTKISEKLLTESNPELTTFLILGVNKELTDSIILAIANDQNHDLTLINVPRDLYYNGRKINELYQKYGINSLKSAIYKITGLNPIKYAVIDLNPFVEIIDTLGGIEINVEKNLYDNQYPNGKGGYTIVSFKKGEQHMDGATALKFARSRETSSDFDRSKRQQLVIAAVKNKIMDLNFLNNLGTGMKTFETISQQIMTDISPIDALSYLKKYSEYNVKSGNILSTQNVFYSTISSGGQYILLPRSKDYTDIQEYINKTIFGTAATTTPSLNPA